jgi:hypothetical protein
MACVRLPLWYTRCLSPPLNGSGLLFDIVVVVSIVPTKFLPSLWAYDDPIVSAVTPALPQTPHPDAGAVMVVIGLNFGVAAGRVVVGPRTLVCNLWSNTRIECRMPPGVVAAASLIVYAASGRSSASTATTPGSRSFALSYSPPFITSVHVNVAGDLFSPAIINVTGVSIVGTGGGEVVTVAGGSFGAPLPMSVWLVRGGANPVHPWLNTLDPGAPDPYYRTA